MRVRATAKWVFARCAIWLVGVLCVAGCVLGEVAGGALDEEWSSMQIDAPWPDGKPEGRWLARYDGYGVTRVVVAAGIRWLELSPIAASTAHMTHASLITSALNYRNIDATVVMQTVAQLRTPEPKAWEAAWLLWHYQDDQHFYYLILKPDGWELGKEDPQYFDAQRFLATGANRTFPIGSANTVEVEQHGAHIVVTVNGARLVAFTDTERPYLSGALGLYCEDSVARFGPVVARVPKG